MRKVPPDLVFACTCGLFERASQSACVVLVPLVALRLGAPLAAVGLVTAAANLAPLFLSIPLGASADRLGSRTIALLGAMMGLVFTLASGFAGSYWLLALWQFGAGIGRAGTWIGAQTLVAAGTGGQRRAHHLGFLSLAAQVGNLVGPVLGGVLLDRWGPRAAFTVAAAVMAVILVAALLQRAASGVAGGASRLAGRASGAAAAPERKEGHETRATAAGPAAAGPAADAAPDALPPVPERPSEVAVPSTARADRSAPGAPVRSASRSARSGGGTDFRRALALFREPGVRLMATTTLVRLSLLALKGSYYVVLLKDWGLSAAAIGTLLSLGSVAAAVVAPLHGPSRRYVSTRGLLLYGLGALALAFAASPLAPGFWPQVGVMVVAGVATGITQPALIAVLAESVAVEEQGLAVGLRTALNRLTGVGTPVLIGALAAVLPLAPLFPLFGAACGVALVLAPKTGGGVGRRVAAD